MAVKLSALSAGRNLPNKVIPGRDCQLQNHIADGKKKKKNSVVWVRERTIPTGRPPLVGGTSANFCGYRVPRGQCDVSLRPYSQFSRPEPPLFYQVAPQLYSRGWVYPVPDPLLLRKSGSAGNRTRASGSVARNSWLLDHRSGDCGWKDYVNWRTAKTSSRIEPSTFPAGSTVPQPTTLPHGPYERLLVIQKGIYIWSSLRTDSVILNWRCWSQETTSLNNRKDFWVWKSGLQRHTVRRNPDVSETKTASFFTVGYKTMQ
jgi:hypothetical protein